ncbi:GNAT family N-acetyltransferase [Lapidilactobacillus wuchangensis]|uniref:GNAT family N-acetyltransferase n=1 Tax=Lapidilactobacillus wuchangensis TaxID=2486001 RepID=UPI000F76DC0E|nr:GNAT family N-acetyltransferase [Lapidilactobacillus wuchangensis]
MTIKSISTTDRSARLIKQLTSLWQRSVTATHDFLTTAEITAIAAEVPTAIAQIPSLLVWFDANQQPQAFLGLSQTEIAMLFVDPSTRGQGIGRQLIQAAIDQYGADRLTVNEQNPQALGFYEHMGFQVAERHPHDDQGRPYPILVMTRQSTNLK